MDLETLSMELKSTNSLAIQAITEKVNNKPRPPNAPYPFAQVQMNLGQLRRIMTDSGILPLSTSGDQVSSQIDSLKQQQSKLEANCLAALNKLK